MATLVDKKIKVLEFIPPIIKNTIELLQDIGQRAVEMVWVTVMASIVIPSTAVAAYLIYSGDALRMLVSVMVWACQNSGSCSNFPAMLSGLAVALVVLSVLAIVMLISIKPLSETVPSADDTALINMLINWYRIGPQERGALLETLDASDVDTSASIRRMLYVEHRDLERMDDHR